MNCSRPRRNSNEAANNPLAAPVKESGRARVLMPSSQSYDVAPKSRIDASQARFARPTNAAGDDFIRKMKAKKAKKASGGR